MRIIALALTPFLPCGVACAQEQDPARMVARIFEETRAESEAIWRAYCAANEAPGFSGQISDLPGWDHYVERMQTAGLQRLAKGFVLDEGRYTYGWHLAYAAQNTLRCEALPGRDLVRIWGAEEDPRRDPEECHYVRVVREEDGRWSLASWPPTTLEALFTERQKFPHRLRLTLRGLQHGDAEVQLETGHQVLWNAQTPQNQRWERFDQYLKDVVWNVSRIGELGESLDGVLIRVDGRASATLLLELLAHLGEAAHRIPDVQLWVTGDFPELLTLNQRGAWGQEKSVVPLWFPPDFTVADAIGAARAAAMVLNDEKISFALPWIGSEPDPLTFLTRLERELRPPLQAFWWEYVRENAGAPGLGRSLEKDSEFLALCAQAEEILEPHLSVDFPRLEADRAIKAWSRHSMSFALDVYRGVMPSGRGWLLQGHSVTPQGSYARIAFREPISAMMSPLSLIFLRLEDGAWKFCSWDRGSWPEEERLLPHAPKGKPYQPVQSLLGMSLRNTPDGLLLTHDYRKEILAQSSEELNSKFSQWLDAEYEYSSYFRRRDQSGEWPNLSINLNADESAPQEALTPLLRMMSQQDCRPTELRMQVLLDDLGRPGELVFDQSLTRSGANPDGATALRLRRGDNLQQLSDRADRLLEDGVTRLYLLPPE